MVQIIPAILATTEQEYKEKLDKLKTIALSKIKGWVQIDLMDQKFVQNESIGPEVIAKYPTEFKLEAHLMVEYPESWIDELVKIPAVTRIIFPVEDAEGVNERIKHIKNHGKEVGLSVNPETNVSVVESYLDQVDVILIMSVHPGFGGQEFIMDTIERIKEVLQLRSGHIQFKIECDGGINEKNAKLVVDAGADYLVIGAHLLEGKLDENLESIWQAIRS